VTNREYAAQIARDWNVKASGVGFVTQFDIDTTYLGQFSVRKVGGNIHTECWIPAEALQEFNAHIIGLIAVIERFGTAPVSASSQTRRYDRRGFINEYICCDDTAELPAAPALAAG
jgi:hypothetical protein